MPLDMIGQKVTSIQPRKKVHGGWYWVSKSVVRSFAARIGFSATAVYHFLASMADGEQRCFPSQQYMARHLGCSRSTVSRAIKGLENEGLICVERQAEQGLVYTLVEPQCSAEETEMSQQRKLPVQNLHTNKNQITRISNNAAVDPFLLKGNTQDSHRLQTREEVLAYDLATGLDDNRAFPRYLKLAFRFPEPFLREKLAEVKQYPAHKIRKSRAALFSYIVHHDSGKHS